MSQKQSENKIKTDVLIVGAGAAGISSALHLTKNSSLSYKIIEAQNRLGGRVYTNDGMDLGASWVHQWNHQKNPVKKLVEELKWPVSGDKQKPEEHFYDSELKGKVKSAIVEKAEKKLEGLVELSIQRANQSEEDQSLMQAVKSEFEEVQQSEDKLFKRVFNQVVEQHHNYEAASLDKVSAKMGIGNSMNEDVEMNVQRYTQEGSTCKDFEDKIPVGGFGSLLNKAAENLDYKLNMEVQSIEKQGDIYEVQTIDTQNQVVQVYETKYVIVTVSLKILQNETIKFYPELSDKKKKAINSLKLGVANKLTLEFKKCFWGSNIQAISISGDQSAKYPIYYNMRRHQLHKKKKRNVLMLLMSDQFAMDMEKMSDEQLVKEAVQKVKDVYQGENFNLDDSYFEVKKHWVTRWGSNKYIQGSYTYYPVGSSNLDCLELATPENQNTLYFAGEACNPDFLGTVNAAFFSAQQAVNNILSEENIDVSSLC